MLAFVWLCQGGRYSLVAMLRVLIEVASLVAEHGLWGAWASVVAAAAAATKSVQLCPALSDPMDCSLPGSSIHGIFQARVLEWGAVAFSKRKCLTKKIL